MAGLLPWSRARVRSGQPQPAPRYLLQGSNAVTEVELKRAGGLQALGEQGRGAGLGRVRDDQLVEPAGVGADRVRAGHGQLVEYLLGGEYRVGGDLLDVAALRD